MITLSRHIELLLLNHDCVVVPGFGGFIANTAPATCTTGDEFQFAPPSRTIAFNRNLTSNDGLLVQSYMQTYETSYPNALRQMQKEVEQMMDQLAVLGSYRMDRIGVFTQNIKGSIEFCTDTQRLPSPVIYGLGGFTLKSVSALLAENSTKPDEETTVHADIPDSVDVVTADKAAELTSHRDDSANKEVIIRIEKRWLDISVAIAASILIFFLFSYPNTKSSYELSDTCVAGALYVGTPSTSKSAEKDALETNPDQTATEVVQEETTENEADAITENTTEETCDKIEASANVSETAENVDNNKTLYTIILASCVTRENSEVFIKKLKELGFPKAEFVRTGKVNRIHYSTFTSEADAQDTLRALKKANDMFSDAWIMKLTK